MGVSQALFAFAVFAVGGRNCFKFWKNATTDVAKNVHQLLAQRSVLDYVAKAVMAFLNVRK